MPGVDPYPTPTHQPAATPDGDRFQKLLAKVRQGGEPVKLTPAVVLPPSPDPRAAVAAQVLAALVTHNGTPTGNPGNVGAWQRWAAFAFDAAEALHAEHQRRHADA